MPLRPLRFAAFLLALCALGTAPTGAADNDRPPAERQGTGLPQINIIDKLLATEAMLGPSLKRVGEDAWAAEYRALYNKYKQNTDALLTQVKSRAVLAMALGAKASDGVLALKGRDVEALNDCAAQIEKLASKLGVPSSYLQRANIVKHHANQQRWIEAFMELGFLQHQIMSSFEARPDQKDDAVLVVIGGWLQAGRCVTSLIQDHYNAQTSSILREPRLVQLMIKEVGKINAEYQADPVFKQVLEFLPIVRKTVDVELRAPVPPEGVKVMNEGFDRLVKAVMTPALAGKGTAGP